MRLTGGWRGRRVVAVAAVVIAAGAALLGWALLGDGGKGRLTIGVLAPTGDTRGRDLVAGDGIDHACTSSAFATFVKRRPDAYGALVFLAGQTFVDPHRVAAVGFSAGARVSLSVAEPNSFEQFVPPGNLRFRAAAAFYPPCKRAVGRPGIPTLIFIGALDDWTPAADCSNKVASWGNDGPPIELVVYPGAYHGFYYSHLQPGRTMFDHWLEYNGEAADNASHRLHQFLDRHLN